MLFRLGVTGCGSRVALGEMLKGFADSLITALRRQHCRSAHKVFGRAGSARNPGMPLRLQSCCDPFASVPAVFGPCPNLNVEVEKRAARQGICFTSPVSSKFISSLAPPGGESRAGAGRLLPLPFWTKPTPSFSLPSFSGGCSELELNRCCYYPPGQGIHLPSRRQVEA